MDTLVTPLKALADASRLKIIALLAQAERSGDELAALLELTPSTVSHHLARLQKAGLVSATADQYYHLYQLETTALADLASALTPHGLATTVEQQAAIDNNAYHAQILARWIKNNRLQALPTAHKQRAVVLAWLVEKFERDQRYAPLQVDDVLNRWCDWHDSRRLDIVSVTRALVDANLLQRTRNGQWFWRADSAGVQANGVLHGEQLPQADTTDLRLPLAPSRLRQLIKVAMSIKANRAIDLTTLDTLLQKHGIDAEATAATRTEMIAESLLTQSDEATYLRPTIGPDHPANIKVRMEALTQTS